MNMVSALLEEMAQSPDGQALPDIAAALRLFDETTRALEARSRRLEEVLTRKQQELLQANGLLQEKVSELDRLSAYLNLIMASVASGVMAVNEHGIITMFNPVAEIMFSHLHGDLIEAPHADVFPQSELLLVIKDGIMRGPYEYKVRAADGRWRIISAKASPIHDNDGNIIGAVEVSEDVTDMRRMQEQLERGERLKALGEMAAGVAHEIRNPLNGIEGFASLLLRDVEDNSQSQRYAQSIVDGVRHLNKTVTGLLEFTRPKEAQKRPIPIAEILRNCIDLVQVEYEQRDDMEQPIIAFDNAWGEELLACDGTQMRQVILNIISNGIQAVEDKQAHIQVACTQTEIDETPSFVLTIEDNGPGIPAADRKTIFTPFYTTKDTGTGLGLAVTHTLIELQGGKISVEDSDQLGGAKFVIQLPLE